MTHCQTPEVDDHTGVLALLVAREGIDEAVGAQLARVVDTYRHPGLGARADDQGLVAQVALEQVSILGDELRHHRRDGLGVDVGESDLTQRQ